MRKKSEIKINSEERIETTRMEIYNNPDIALIIDSLIFINLPEVVNIGFLCYFRNS